MRIIKGESTKFSNVNEEISQGKIGFSNKHRVYLNTQK